MEYEVRITVVQELTVPVEADSMAGASRVAELNWKSNEYENPDTHSRLRRDRVTYEALYPDRSAMRATNVIDIRSRKVAEAER